MKNIFIYPIFVLLLLILAGCPVSSSYPLGKRGEVTLDKSLLGTWVTVDEDAEVRQFTFASSSIKNVFKVTVEEQGEMYAAEGNDFLAWFTLIDGNKFLVLQQIIDEVEQETYYVYHITYDKNQMITHDISLKVKGTEAITSIESYREEVKQSMKFEDFLGDEIIWKRK